MIFEQLNTILFLQPQKYIFHNKNLLKETQFNINCFQIDSKNNDHICYYYLLMQQKLEIFKRNTSRKSNTLVHRRLWI